MDDLSSSVEPRIGKAPQPERPTREAIRALAADGKLAERGFTRESHIAFSEGEICALSDDTRWGSIR
jgi:hypothetical protein